MKHNIKYSNKKTLFFVFYYTFVFYLKTNQNFCNHGPI